MLSTFIISIRVFGFWCFNWNWLAYLPCLKQVFKWILFYLQCHFKRFWFSKLKLLWESYILHNKVSQNSNYLTNQTHFSTQLIILVLNQTWLFQKMELITVSIYTTYVEAICRAKIFCILEIDMQPPAFTDETKNQPAPAFWPPCGLADASWSTQSSL